MWSGKWQPTPVFLPGESHGQRKLAGCSPWGCESRTRLSDFDYFDLTITYMEVCVCTHTHARSWASLVAQSAKNLPAMQKTQVRSLGQEKLLEKGMATHCNIFA